jgi:hypothetical protein
MVFHGGEGLLIKMGERRSRMKKRMIFAAAVLGLFTVSCANDTGTVTEEASVAESPIAESKWLELTGTTSWQEDRGTWAIAGSVSLDPNDDAALAFDAGEGIWVNGPEGKTVDLHSTVDHGDVEAHIEFMVPKGSNSGLYFQSRYEVQIFDSWGVEEPEFSDCGGIYQRWRDEQGFEGHPPRENASRAPGEWQSFDVVFRAPRFDSAGNKTENARFVKVVHNGVIVHENVEVTGPTRAATFEDEVAMGPLMVQGDHGPVAFKNARIKRVELD